MFSRPWDPLSAAKAQDARTSAELLRLGLPEPGEYVTDIRFYLQRMTDRGRTLNGARLVAIQDAGNGTSLIEAGPTVFKEPCEQCILFRSGAKLSFGVTLRSDTRRSTMLAYRFHLQLLPASGLKFVRIDLNTASDVRNGLDQPRSHIHPGFEGIHIPFPLMSPLEVLDRIFRVIEPYFSR